jgi:hypothetical protein
MAMAAQTVTLPTISARPAAGAATGGTLVFRHALPASNSNVSAASLETPGTAHPGGGGGGKGGNRYPADLTYLGGPVVTSMQSHTIYLNPTSTCPAVSCFGDPITFLSDLGKSRFVHIIDQFTGSTADNRYTVGTNYIANYPAAPSILTDADIQLVVSSAVAFSNLYGYGHEYHVFIAPGTDECFDSTYTQCYSPDNPPSFYFCAYHGSFDLAGYGHVLYSVEPYQNVPGCSDTGATPNGTLADSTNNVLSHELFETITDPDGSAWRNITDNALYGSEIGDECSFINTTGFDPSVWHVGSRTYATQPEYSNILHTCNTNADD